MRTFVRAVLVSVALTSASLAFACPIDLAPREAEVTLSADSVRPNEAVLRTLSADVDAVAPSAMALLDDKDAPIAAADDQDTVPIIQDDARAEMTDVLSSPSPDAATTPQKVLFEGEDIIEADYTGSIGPGAPSNPAEQELALDGYEDR